MQKMKKKVNLFILSNKFLKLKLKTMILKYKKRMRIQFHQEIFQMIKYPAKVMKIMSWGFTKSY